MAYRLAVTEQLAALTVAEGKGTMPATTYKLARKPLKHRQPEHERFDLRFRRTIVLAGWFFATTRRPKRSR